MSRRSIRSSGGAEDAVLVRAAIDGDRRAPGRIVERYTPLIARWVGSPFDDADRADRVQEVFLRCFAQLARLRDPRSLRSYLIGIALRVRAMDRRRGVRRRHERLTTTGELPEMPAWQPSIETRRVASRTSAMLDRMRPESSRLLELRFIDEREVADVARDLGCSRATAKRRLIQATARVRALVGSEPVLVEYLRSGRRSACARVAP